MNKNGRRPIGIVYISMNKYTTFTKSKIQNKTINL